VSVLVIDICHRHSGVSFVAIAIDVLLLVILTYTLSFIYHTSLAKDVDWRNQM